MTARRSAFLIFVFLGCFINFFQPTPASASEQIPTTRIAGDFDRDHRADFAVAGVSGNTFKVHLHLSGKRKRLTLTTSVQEQFGLRLSVFDIDQDSDADIVLIDPLLQTSAVWINQGNGEFQKSSRWLGRLIDRTRDPQLRRTVFRTNVEPAAAGAERMTPGLAAVPSPPNAAARRTSFLHRFHRSSSCSDDAIFLRAPPA
jgi:hypothetical protein